MKGPAFLAALFLVSVATAGCASSIAEAHGLLPEGIEEARLPEVQLGGYLFVSSSPPLTLSTEDFLPASEGSALSTAVPPSLRLERATLVVGTSSEDFAGTLDLASEGDAERARQIFQEELDRAKLWSKLASPRLHLVHGEGAWAKSARSSLESNRLVTVRDHDPEAWKLLTNLPQRPPSRPLAAGALKLSTGLLESLGAQAGLALDEVGYAFEVAKVETVGLAVYAEEPLEVSARADWESLRRAQPGVLFISHSGYPGFLVSFMLGVVGRRAEMDVIPLGSTNARYRAIGDLHLVVKNRGSLLFAALSGTREGAEGLILTAIYQGPP